MKFTPVQKETGERLLLEIDDQVIPRGKWMKAIEVNGKKYICEGKACSLPKCFCDAYIIGYKE